MGMMEQGLLRGMASMGGGIAYSGGACGALIGAIVFLGSLLGKDDPEKKDDPNLQKACSEFYKRFKDEVMVEWGSVNCIDITGVDWKDPVQVKAFRKEGGRLRCANFAGKAARILGEILEKYLGDKAS
jgi:C_GCAxxG_C_C family probable redox protein